MRPWTRCRRQKWRCGIFDSSKRCDRVCFPFDDSLHFVQHVLRLAQTETCKALLDDIPAQYTSDVGPLHLAVQIAPVALVLFIAKHAHVHINSVDRDGCTALHLAAKSGRTDVVKALLSLPNINFAAVDNEGLMPDDTAKNHDIAEMIKRTCLPVL